MEESLKFIPIQQNISPHLFLNLQNNYITNTQPHHHKSYFSVVQKFKQKEKERTQEQKKKTGFVQKFYQKLKKDLQNSTDQKTLQQNLSLMNICLKHKHSRNASQTLPTATSTHKKLQLTKRQPSTNKQAHFQQNIFHIKTSRIIISCQKQNEDLGRIHKNMGLFKYYNKKLSRNLYNSHLKIKKTEIQY